MAAAASVGTTNDAESVDSLHSDRIEVDSVDPASWVTEYIKRSDPVQNSTEKSREDVDSVAGGAPETPIRPWEI
jgi:hypothetical protein